MPQTFNLLEGGLEIGGLALPAGLNRGDCICAPDLWAVLAQIDREFTVKKAAQLGLCALYQSGLKPKDRWIGCDPEPNKTVQTKKAGVG